MERAPGRALAATRRGLCLPQACAALRAVLRSCGDGVSGRDGTGGQGLRGSLDAIEIARSTFCQFARTWATAGEQTRKRQSGRPACGRLGGRCSPCVPSASVPSFSSSSSICCARAALRSRSCTRFSSSCFFSLMRCTSAGDCECCCAGAPYMVPEEARGWDCAGP